MTTMSQKEIAEALKVSPKTVNLHAGMVYKKCGVFGRVGLILKVTAEHS
jgi:DNA-binding CsgD family transcriptional regulator